MTGKMGLLKTTALAHFLQILNQIIQHKIAIWQRRLAMTTQVVSHHCEMRSERWQSLMPGLARRADAMDQKQCRPPAL
jgi:hypothetical protein